MRNIRGSEKYADFIFSLLTVGRIAGHVGSCRREERFFSQATNTSRGASTALDLTTYEEDVTHLFISHVLLQFRQEIVAIR